MKNVTKKFPKEVLKELAGEEPVGTLESVSCEIQDTSRWSIHYKQVFKDTSTGKFYITHFSCGATESQDERPYEYEGDEVECIEVEPKEKVVITYVAVKVPQ